MKAYILIGPKDWIKCPVCGDKYEGRRLRPMKFRGKMRFNEAKGKMVCNKCEFSFAFNELKPKKEFIEAVSLMQRVSEM